MASDQKFSDWYFAFSKEHNRTPSQEEVWNAALAQPAPVQQPLKDHQIAKLVNDLRDVAKEYGQTQQLRERIAGIVRDALVAPVQAGAQQAVGDGSTPGLWFVRKRERDGELLDCFVAAPDCQGLPYGAEILGDDEYREDTGITRKLADCELIVKAVAAYRAAPTQAGAGDAKGGA